LGVVIKQSLKATIHIYAGVVIGFLTVVLVFPRIFSPGEIGLLNILMQLSLLVSQFGIMGMPGIITYYFSTFKDAGSNHHGFPVIVLIGTLLGCVLSVAFIFIFRSWLLSKYPNALFEAHFIQLVPLTLASIIYSNLDGYYKGFYNVVLATFLKETLQRVLIVAGTLFVALKLCSFDTYVILYTLAIVIPSVWLAVAIIRDGHMKMQTDWKFVTPSLRNGMLTVGIFNIVTSISSYINFGIDRIMVSSISGLEAGGIYATTILFGTLVSIPSRTVRKITSALMGEYWLANDTEKLYDIYKKSCVTLYIIGCLLFLGIWVNIDNILKLLPPEYAAGKWAIFWGCMTSLTEMIAGAAGPLLSTSKKYKSQTVQTLILLFVILAANWLLIPRLGMTGAALATTIGFFSFNVFRHFYIVYHWKMQPYGKDVAIVTLLALATFTLVYFIPRHFHFLIDTVIRGTLVVVVFGCSVFFLKISTEVNNAVLAVLKKVPVMGKLWR